MNPPKCPPRKHVGFFCLLTICLASLSSAQSNPVPLVYQPLVPDSVKPGHKGFTLTVEGAGFASGVVVEWNGSTRVTQVVSSSKVKATIDAADVAKIGTASVTVVNPAPGGGTSNVVYFPIRQPLSSFAFAPDPHLRLPTGAGIVSGDFNGDGKLDVATSQCQGNSCAILVFFGNGDGTFQSPVKTVTQYDVGLVVAGDFNSDGKLDLIGEYYSNGIEYAAVFMGRGDGTFTEEPSFIGGQQRGLNVGVLGDVNGDGFLDVWTVGCGSTNCFLTVDLGDGKGNFTMSWYFNLSYGDLFAGPVPVGDFNGDGKLDLVLPPGFDTGGVFLGNGDGTFNGPVLNSPQISGLAVDLNHDGKVDVITGDAAAFLSNGDGTFQEVWSYQVSNPTGAVSAGDFNGDGIMDFATVSFDANLQTLNWLVFLGKGDGTFQDPIESTIYNVPYGSGLDLGDFNGDGKLDLVLADVSNVFLQTTLNVNPLQLNFGDQNVGTSSQPQTVTLTNIGKSSLPIKKIAIGGSDPNDYSQTNNCGKSLPAGHKCQVQVIFKPTETGERDASLSISYQGVASPQIVSLIGFGVNLTVSLTPSQLTFPVQLINTTSSPQVATLMNTGTDTVTISSISTKVPFAETNNCPSSLPANQSCQISVTFTPTQGGNAAGALYVYDDAQGSPQTVALSGTGTVVRLSASSVNFGDQKVGTKSSPVPIKLTNEGKTSLSITQITISGADSGDFSETNNCGKSVPAGGHCTIKVTFMPQATGQRSATLDVYDNGGGSPQTVSLTGTGT